MVSGSRSLVRSIHRVIVGLGVALIAVILMATPLSAGMLDASWTAPTTKVDGSPLTDLAGYRVYYGATSAPCPGPTFVTVTSPTPSPGPNQTVNVRLMGLTAGVAYYVSVTAVDSSGGESDCFAPAPSAVSQVDFTVAPTGTVDFGTVAVNTSADRTFTVANTGGGTITGSVAATAPFSVVAGSPFSLVGAGAAQAVTVRFSPITSGAVTANVNFVAGGSTTFRMVSGTGEGSDTIAPTVAITSPGSAPTTSTSLTLGGTASDNVGVTQVSWVNSRGGSGTASGTTAWTAAGIVLQPGANVLTVTARDAAGNTGTASVIVTSDATPPTVAITSPVPPSTTAASVTLAGTAADNIAVTRVSWVNSRGGSGTASGTATWTTAAIALQPGANALTVTAWDAAGNTATASTTVARTDATAPTVSLTAPGAGTTLGGVVTVAATAGDDVGVVGVQFKVDGVNLGAEVTAAPYAMGWNTVGSLDGPHTLTAVARDATGNTATSAAVTVTVSNVVPTGAVLGNGAFETFTGTLATGWSLATDGVVAVATSSDTGLSGLAQKVTITTPGQWGLYLYQQPPLKVNQRYEWTLWYKTSGANVLWAQVADAPMNQVVLSQALPATNGAWRQQTLAFTYTNGLANQLRISSNDAGSFWLDGFVLREVSAGELLANGGFEALNGTLATGWVLATDGTVAVTTAADTGQAGMAQKVTITRRGGWGLYLYQRPGLTVGRRYEWTLWYKTSGTNGLWAQITDAPMSQVAFSQALPGTNGVWRQQTLTFTYANGLADRLRITTNAIGSFWLDEFRLREIAP